MDELELVDALRTGDEAAFVVLVGRYQPGLLRVAESLVPSRAVGALHLTTGDPRLNLRRSDRSGGLRVDGDTNQGRPVSREAYHRGASRHRFSRRLERAMALQEKHRNTMYNEFTKILGEEAAQAMLSYFPARDVEEPATKADIQLVRAEVELVRAEVELLRGEVRGEVELLRGEVRGEVELLRGEVRGEVELVRGEVAQVSSELAVVAAELRAEMATQAVQITNQLTNRMITIAGIGLAAITVLLAAFT